MFVHGNIFSVICKAYEILFRKIIIIYYNTAAVFERSRTMVVVWFTVVFGLPKLKTNKWRGNIRSWYNRSAVY